MFVIVLLVLWKVSSKESWDIHYGRWWRKKVGIRLPLKLQNRLDLDFLNLLYDDNREEHFECRVVSHMIYALAFVASWILHVGWSSMSFVVVTASFIGIMPYLKLTEQAKVERKQMSLALSAILVRFALNINAGVVVTNALNNSLMEHGSSFESMLAFRLAQVSKGLSLELALMPVAQKSYDDYVTRFVRIVISDHRNGSKETYAAIKVLMSDVRKHRRSLLLKQSEEASTRLLLPMAIALVGIVVALTFPAIVSLFRF